MVMYPNGNEFMSALSMFIYKAIVSNRKRILELPTNLRNPKYISCTSRITLSSPIRESIISTSLFGLERFHMIKPLSKLVQYVTGL